MGGYIYKHLSKKHNVKKINLRYRKNFEENFTSHLPSYKIDYFIHLAFIKNSLNLNFNFLNYEIPIKIINILKKNNSKAKFIYFSSINVLLKKKFDKYSITKSKIEKMLINYENVIIIRIPLVLSSTLEGDRKKLSRFVNIIPFLSLIPFKGSRINFININELEKSIEIVINNFNKNILNIISDKYIYLYEIAENLANGYKLYFKIDYFIIFLKKISPALSSIDYEKEINIEKKYWLAKIFYKV